MIVKLKQISSCLTCTCWV